MLFTTHGLFAHGYQPFVRFNARFDGQILVVIVVHSVSTFRAAAVVGVVVGMVKHNFVEHVLLGLDLASLNHSFPLLLQFRLFFGFFSGQTCQYFLLVALLSHQPLSFVVAVGISRVVLVVVGGVVLGGGVRLRRREIGATATGF